MNPIVIIPARMASTRLPGKPLADIHGKPMIVHVLERGREADLGPVAVACGDAEIADAVRAAGGRAVLTDPDLPSGSDRVFAALAELDPDGRHDVVVNLQGDLPTITEAQLRPVIDAAGRSGVRHRHPGGADRVRRGGKYGIVREGRLRVRGGQAVAPALYFSRQPIPWGDGPRWHHVGIYAYRRAALARYVALPPSPLERREKLEQLRALEAGMRIACARIDHGPFGVDTPEDLERARRVLAPGGPA